jgi:hypothetical protein
VSSHLIFVSRSEFLSFLYLILFQQDFTGALSSLHLSPALRVF